MLEDYESKKGLITGYIITNAICILFVIFHLIRFEIFKQKETQEIIKILADAFVVPGSLLLLITAYISLTNQGSTDAIGYMLKRFGQMMIPTSKKKMEKYSDYVANKKRVKGYGFLGWSGLIYFVIGMILTGVYFIV